MDEFLVKNDPCRGEYPVPVPALHQAPQLQILRDPSVSIIIMTILLHTSKQKCHITHYNLATKQIGIYIVWVLEFRVQSVPNL